MDEDILTRLTRSMKQCLPCTLTPSECGELLTEWDKLVDERCALVAENMRLRNQLEKEETSGLPLFGEMEF